MKKCSKCGKLTESNFCPDCGTDLKDCKQIAVCPNCGHEVESKFCPYCGCDMEKKEIGVSVEMGKELESDSAIEMPENTVFEKEKAIVNKTVKADDMLKQSDAIDYEKKEKFYKKNWFIILMLIIFFPVGLFLMWKYSEWKKVVKIIVSVLIAVLFLIGLFLPSEDTSYDSDSSYSYEDESDYEYDYEEEQEEPVDLFTTESDYAAVGYDALARTPDTYEYTKVQGTGKVIQVIEGDGETDLRIALNDDYDTVVLVYYDSDIVTSRILEDDYVTYYGTSYGLYTYESTMGGDITVPLIEVHKIVQN